MSVSHDKNFDHRVFFIYTEGPKKNKQIKQKTVDFLDKSIEFHTPNDLSGSKKGRDGVYPELKFYRMGRMEIRKQRPLTVGLKTWCTFKHGEFPKSPIHVIEWGH